MSTAADSSVSGADLPSWKAHITSEPILKYISQHSLRLHPAQEKLIKVTNDHPLYEMLGSADELQFLANLVRLMGARKTLDVGTYTGYSALSIALALPDGGTVVTMDITDEYVNMGKPFWKEANVDAKIDLKIAPALETLGHLVTEGHQGTFDFAFIDADKENYPEYYELCMALVRPGGVIAVDNVLWSGQVVDDRIIDDETRAIRNLNTKVKADSRVDVSMLFIGDGLTLAFKK